VEPALNDVGSMVKADMCYPSPKGDEEGPMPGLGQCGLVFRLHHARALDTTPGSRNAAQLATKPPGSHLGDGGYTTTTRYAVPHLPGTADAPGGQSGLPSARAARPAKADKPAATELALHRGRQIIGGGPGRTRQLQPSNADPAVAGALRTNAVSSRGQ